MSISTNAAPNDPVLDTNWVPESATNGTIVGRISVSDPDGDALSVSIVDAYGDTDLASAFELVYDPEAGNYKLVVRDAAKINYEVVGGTINLRIKVADATQAVFKDFAITVVDVNEAPTDIIIRNRSVEEHAAAGTWVTDIGGNDPDAGDVLSYSLKDAATSPFEIVKNEAGVYQLRVRDGSQIDYASDPDKKIEVTIVATDKYGLAVEKTFMLDIIDVNHAPTDIVLTEYLVREHALTGSYFDRLKAVDPDGGDTFTYTLLDDADGRFAIEGDYLKAADGLRIDFERQPKHDIRVLVTDSAGNSFEKTITLQVRDVIYEYVVGSAGDDFIMSGHNRDRLDGAGGNDTLVSGGGNDYLIGGTGSDVFVFDTVPDAGTNIDQIKDFSVSSDSADQIWLSKSVFDKLLSAAGDVLDVSEFHIGTGAADLDDRIVYDQTSGALYYDSDGSSSMPMVQFATLTPSLALTNSSFLIVT